MNPALLVALLLVGCGFRRHSDVREDSARRAELEQRTQTEAQSQASAQTTTTTTAGPVDEADRSLLIIPPGAVLDTPQGRLTVPKDGPPAKLYRGRKKHTGSVTNTATRAEARSDSSIQNTDTKAKVDETDKKVALGDVSGQAGPDWGFWAGVAAGALVVVGLLVWLLLRRKG